MVTLVNPAYLLSKKAPESFKYSHFNLDMCYYFNYLLIDILEREITGNPTMTLSMDTLLIPSTKVMGMSMLNPLVSWLPCPASEHISCY